MELRTVTTEIAMTLLVEGEGSWTVPSTFRFDPNDPFAVHVAMTANGCVVEWAFAREILAEGLGAPAGLGDVQVYPCLDEDGSETVRLRLCSPEGEAVLEARAGELVRFFEDTLRSVPLGAEIDHLDVESALIGLLADR
ncbi:MAG: SsgA family sporulation/cell division regulator [Sporichthyaceae bacterium]|jgi:hypothetical protein